MSSSSRSTPSGGVGLAAPHLSAIAVGEGAARSYHIGRLQFLVTGGDPIMPYLQEILAPLAAEPSGDEELRFDFGEKFEASPGATFAADVPVFTADGSYVVHHTWTSHRVAQRDGMIQVAARSADPPWRERAGDRLAHALGFDYAATRRAVANQFVIHVFKYLAQVAQLKVGQSYIHASGLARDGIGIAIVGGDCSGKTSTMLELVFKDGWHYVGNDLLPLDEDGVIWRNVEWVPVNAEHMVGQELIKRGVLGGHHRMRNEAHFEWKRWRRGEFLVAPERLFGAEHIAPQARLRTAFFLERANVTQFSATTLSLEEACRRVVMNLLGVMIGFVKLSLAVHTGKWMPVLPTVQRFYEETESIVAGALEPVERLGITIPLRATPQQVAGFLRRFLGEMS